MLYSRLVNILVLKHGSYQLASFLGFLGSYENLIGQPMNTRFEPVKRQFPNVEHCENDMLHCCAARFSLLLTFIHRLNQLHQQQNHCRTHSQVTDKLSIWNSGRHAHHAKMMVEQSHNLQPHVHNEDPKGWMVKLSAPPQLNEKLIWRVHSTK